MIIDILPYLQVIALSLFLSIFRKKIYEKKIVFLLISNLFLISVLRYDVGADYQTYIEMFEHIKNNLTYKDIFDFTEPLYFLLNKLVLIFTSNSIYLFLVSSICIYFILYQAILRISSEPIFSIFLYIVTTYFFISLNQIRQSISIVIFLYSLPKLINGENRKFILLNLIGFLFHYSAAITILALFIKKIDFKKWFYLGLILASLLLSSQIDLLLSDKLLLLDNIYSDYLKNDHFIEKNSFAIIKQIVPNLIIVISIYYLDRFSLKEKILFNLYFFSVLYLNVFFGKNIFIRPVFYFDIILIIYLPVLINRILLNKYNKLALQIIFSIYFIILTFAGIFIGGGQGVVPYKFYFQ